MSTKFAVGDKVWKLPSPRNPRGVRKAGVIDSEAETRTVYDNFKYVGYYVDIGETHIPFVDEDLLEKRE